MATRGLVTMPAMETPAEPSTGTPAPTEPASAELLDEPAAMEAIEAGWDALAVRAGAPFGAPAWALGWWRHLAPRGSRLAVVAVRAGEEPIGIAPFYAVRRLGLTELRLLGGGLSSRLGVLAAPGREDEVAAGVARVLAERGVNIVRWEGIDAAAAWDERLRQAWPGQRQPRRQAAERRSAPVIRLEQESYEDWLAGKGGKYRREVLRRRRKLEEAGAQTRAATLATLDRDLDAFGRLHFGRWEDRGGSSVPPEAIQMLAEAGRSLLPEGRFRLWLIDGPGGEAISARILIAAGGTVAAWNKGFDPSWGKFGPGVLSAQTAIEEAFQRGDSLFDLGGGETDDKQRLADEDCEIAWTSTLPPGARYPLARLETLPRQLARGGSRKLRARLGEERFHRLRGLVNRRR